MENDRTLPPMNDYRTLTPGARYNAPDDVKETAKLMEPHHGCKTSWDYLKEYIPLTQAEQKAKAYWTDCKAYETDRAGREALRQEVPGEAEKLRNMAWRWHVRIHNNERICRGYHTSASVYFNIGLTIPPRFYSSDPTYNMANRNMLTPMVIPEDFLYLDDYIALEPHDREIFCSNDQKIPLAFSVPIASESKQGLSEAVKYWTSQISKGQITKVEADSIREAYPEEVEHFRELIWKRHLMNEGRIDVSSRYNAELSQKEWEQTKNTCLKVTAITATVAAAVFFSFRLGPHSLLFPGL